MWRHRQGSMLEEHPVWSNRQGSMVEEHPVWRPRQESMIESMLCEGQAKRRSRVLGRRVKKVLWGQSKVTV